MENPTHSIRAGHKSCSAVMVLIFNEDQDLALGDRSNQCVLLAAINSESALLVATARIGRCALTNDLT